MTTEQWIEAVLLPLVGALQFFAVEYGYRGADREIALRKSSRVMLMLMLISATYVAVNQG